MVLALTVNRGLYRIYYYDCPPLDKQIKYPLPDGTNKTPSTKNFKTHMLRMFYETSFMRS